MGLKLSGLNTTLGGGIAAIALVTLVAGLGQGVTLASVREATFTRGRTYQIVGELDAFRSAMLNQETGLRGYLLRGTSADLGPYRLGTEALERSLTHLSQLLSDSTPETARLRAAEDAARDWRANVAEPAIAKMDDPRQRSAAATIESSGQGKHYFDRFRAQLDEIQSDEERRVASSQARLAHSEQVYTAVLWAGVLLTLLICFAVAVAIRRLVSRPLLTLTAAMRRLAKRDLAVDVPGVRRADEVGEMARAVEVFKAGMIELDRSSLLRATADTIPALVGYIDAERRVGFLNEEFGRWFDLGVEDVSQVYGRPISDVFARDPLPGTGAELDEALGGAHVQFEARLARFGQAQRDVEATYRPHLAPDGRVLGAVALLTDISERKHVDRLLTDQARDLARSNEELEQFAYVASHDLKAPLRGIENLVGWIEEDLDTALTGDSRVNMDLLKSRVRRLENLLDDLLAYSRAGRGSEKVEVVDTHALVAELAELIAPPEGFLIAASPLLPTMTAAKAPLTQALQNLIGNAIKHRGDPARGSVHIDVEPREKAFEFTITDDGPGVPARFRERVFGMFQTLKPRDEVEGSGMGLAIVKKLVERQGGKVWLDDGPHGRGLSVHLLWPDRGGN